MYVVHRIYNASHLPQNIEDAHKGSFKQANVQLCKMCTPPTKISLSDI